MMSGCTNDMILRRLVAAIQSLGNRDWFDYLAVAAPLLLSIVAIWISVSTARKQNRIALFTIRYDAIVDIRNILLFESKIQSDTENKIIKVFYDGFFGTDITNKNEEESIVQILSTTTRLEKSALVKILVRKKHIDEVHNAIIAMQSMMIDVVAEGADTTEKAKFHDACAKLLAGAYKDLCKKVRV